MQEELRVAQFFQRDRGKGRNDVAGRTGVGAEALGEGETAEQ